jgi:hypothetical protein
MTDAWGGTCGPVRESIVSANAVTEEVAGSSPGYVGGVIAAPQRGYTLPPEAP